MSNEPLTHVETKYGGHGDDVWLFVDEEIKSWLGRIWRWDLTCAYLVIWFGQTERIGARCSPKCVGNHSLCSLQSFHRECPLGLCMYKHSADSHSSFKK